MFTTTVRYSLANLIKYIVGSQKKIGLVGVPFKKGQGKDGVENGPKVLRQARIVEHLKSIAEDIDVKDYGDLIYTMEAGEEVEMPNMKKYAHVAACNQALSKQVEQMIKEERLVITLGGDHSIGIGSIDGHARAKNANVSIIWVDAHADLNTNVTSESGNVHGMPLALLVKELADYWPYLPRMDWQQPMILARHVAYIGLRSVDPYERLILDKWGICAYAMADVEDMGIAKVAREVLQCIDPYQERSLHVSFDIDALDKLEAPSTGTAVRGGLTLREGVHLMEAVAATGRLGAMDLVEVNPEIGTAQDVEKTVEAAIAVVMAACGHLRRGGRVKVDDLPKMPKV